MDGGSVYGKPCSCVFIGYNGGHDSKTSSVIRRSGSWAVMAPALLALGYMVILAPTLSRFDLLSLDESSYAAIARTAAWDGGWWPLRWQGEVFLDKPPLLMWVQALGLRWVGAPVEWVIRWPALLASAATLGLVAYWAGRLSASLGVGGLIALLLGSQLHSLLYARCGSLDALFTLFALLGLHTLTRDMAQGRAPWIAGLWMLAAALFKTWFALAWLLPAILVLILSRSARWSPRHSMALLLAPTLFIVFWLGVGWTTQGKHALGWELGYNLAGRLSGGAWHDLLIGKIPSQPGFYADLIEHGAAGLAVCLPWAAAVCFGPRAARLDLSERVLWATAMGWLALITLGMGASINYLLPLLPLSALLVAMAWGRQGIEFRIAFWLCAGLSGLASLGFIEGAWFWTLPWVPALLRLAPSAQRWDLSARPSLALGLSVTLACVPASLYIRKPPQQNKALVEGLKSLPAAWRGQTALWVGDLADAQVAEFYTGIAMRRVNDLSQGQASLALTRDTSGALRVLRKPATED